MLTYAWAGYGSLPAFTGYPYLVTRIGACALRHLAIVPADWSRDRLLELLERQASTNQMSTCLVLGPADALYVDVDVDRDRDETGAPTASRIVPSGMPVIERILLPVDVPETPEMAGRRIDLRLFAERHRGSGYIVGDNLEGGRVASPEDLARLAAGDPGGSGPGLAACRTCGELAGDLLQIGEPGTRYPGPRVIRVDCRCANHNHCARCGEALADRRLSAYFWDGLKQGAWYVAAYSALSHRCRRSGIGPTIGV
jgi:hypothetical protein